MHAAFQKLSSTLKYMEQIQIISKANQSNKQMKNFLQMPSNRQTYNLNNTSRYMINLVRQIPVTYKDIPYEIFIILRVYQKYAFVHLNNYNKS